MPYAEAWNVTDPSGAEQANNIDDHIRKVRRQIEERVEATLYTDFALDPLVLKDEITGKKTGKLLVISFAEFVGVGSAPNVDYNGANLDSDDVVIVPIKLPVGVTITKIELLSDKGANPNLTGVLYKREFIATGAIGDKTSVATVINNIAGLNISSIAALTEVTTGTFHYWFQLTNSGAFNFTVLALRITYDAPDHRATI